MSDPMRLSPATIVDRAGITPERLQELVSLGLLEPGPGGHDAGDLVRIRLLEAFEAAGVPAEALSRAQAKGVLSFDAYPELHAPRDLEPGRTYADLESELGADRLALLYTAFGLARPVGTSNMTRSQERLLRELSGIDAEDNADLLLGTVRLFAEAARRASDGALSAYHEATKRVGAEARLPAGEPYHRLLLPWAHFSRLAPDLAAWLVEVHLAQAIDAYSVEETERMLGESGFVPVRPETPPAIAFVDLSGFTRLSQELGDDESARMALQLGAIASAVAERSDGRLVKLLGDGALLRFRDASSAVRGSLELLSALPAAGLPTAHAGVHAGRVVSRDGDVFGRTVNYAARLSDLAGPGELLLAESLAEDLPELPRPFDRVGPVQLQGIGERMLVRLTVGTIHISG